MLKQFCYGNLTKTTTASMLPLRQQGLKATSIPLSDQDPQLTDKLYWSASGAVQCICLDKQRRPPQVAMFRHCLALQRAEWLKKMVSVI